MIGSQSVAGIVKLYARRSCTASRPRREGDGEDKWGRAGGPHSGGVAPLRINHLGTSMPSSRNDEPPLGATPPVSGAAVT
eukprot:15485259-Alexandrium_andersonii.AAC.1